MCGHPRVFARLSGCNLTCRWCDTAYTWRWSHKSPHIDGIVYDPSVEVLKLTASELAEAIGKLPSYPIIFTGGEPMLQQGGILETLGLLAEPESRLVEFETNGTRAPDPEILSATSLFVVSPKLQNSGVGSEGLVDPDFVSGCAAEKSCFKFVVGNTSDLNVVDEYVVLNQIAPEKVWLMPEGRTVSELDSRIPWIAKHCVSRAYRLSDRLHIRIAGETRGT